MRALIACAVFGSVIVPAPLGAQSLSLTESDALALLASDSPRVLSARAAVDVARAEIEAAARWPNPRVSLTREAVAGVTENLVTVAQPLPVTGRRQLEANAAAARTDAVASRADEQVRRLRADMRLAYMDLWVAQVREDESAGSRDRVSGLADVLGKREAAGESAGFDRLRAERELIEVEADRALAAVDRGRAQAVLGGFFARAPAGTIRPMPPPAAPAVLPSVDELMARAETVRGDLQALRHEQAAALLSEQAADRRWIPEPEVIGGTKSSSLGSGDVGSIFGVHFAVPLFDRALPERASAQARARQAQAGADALRLVLRAQIAAWRAAVVERRQAADRYRAAVAANAGEIERIARVSYEAGERGILELLDAYRLGSSARLRQAALDASVREAEIELEFVSGWEIP
jgi:cobalt-zinc-cadmium efflux system outer membrane protein